MKCETCKWWKERFNVRASCIDTVGTEVLHLGHCEPERHVGNPHPINVVQRHYRGLTASDYSCPEYKERGRLLPKHGSGP